MDVRDGDVPDPGTVEDPPHDPPDHNPADFRPRLRLEHEKRTLRCVLTETELRRRGQDLAYGLRKVSEHEADLAAAKSQYKSVIDRATAEVATLREAVATGSEFREVTCDLFFDYDQTEVRTYRTDTGEELERRPMTTAEKQREIEFDAPAAT